MEKKTCLNCKNREKCLKLCYPAEQYINQDYNEEEWHKISFTPILDENSQPIPESVSTTEAIIQNYFLDRMEPKEIAEKYFKSRQYVSKIILKYKKILIQNLKKQVEFSSYSK